VARDPVLLTVVLLPQLLAIVGYAFWIGFLDSYYYLPMMPVAVLTVVLGVTACLPARAARIVSIAMLACVLAVVPSRFAAAHVPDTPHTARSSKVRARSSAWDNRCEASRRALRFRRIPIRLSSTGF
jgi:hypothetical protein